jgi:ABC-type glycerol-3-phosphate transport system substrate-binding protein
MLKKMTILIIAVSMLLAGCGDIKDTIGDQYQYEDVVYDDANSVTRIYRTSGTSVEKVAKELNEKHPAKEISKEDPERMLLMYEDDLVQVIKDPDQPQDVIVEVSEREFVRRNADRSMLETYFTLAILMNFLNYSRSSAYYGSGGGYYGYIDMDGGYSKKKRSGSVRYGSVTGVNPRGGGPGVGK